MAGTMLQRGIHGEVVATRVPDVIDSLAANRIGANTRRRGRRRRRRGWGQAITAPGAGFAAVKIRVPSLGNAAAAAHAGRDAGHVVSGRSTGCPAGPALLIPC